MSILSRLSGKGKKIKLGEIEVEIKPLTFTNSDLMVKMGNEETRGEATKELIKVVLKNSVPDATDEEIDNISIEHISVLMEAITDVCGLDKNIPDDKAKLIAKLKKNG